MVRSETIWSKMKRIIGEKKEVIKNQIRIGILSGLLAALLTGFGFSDLQSTSQNMQCAWWGCLYPKFCFGERIEDDDMGTEIRHPKISFYLAKLLDW